jgi:hypothetical protein
MQNEILRAKDERPSGHTDGSYQNDRSKRGEISVSTIPKYYRATKPSCEMNDNVLGWKKIAILESLNILIYA